jgi:hypothetical protein
VDFYVSIIKTQNNINPDEVVQLFFLVALQQEENERARRCWTTLIGMASHNLIKSVDENVIKLIHAVTKRKNVASSSLGFRLAFVLPPRSNVSLINHFG